MKKIDFYHYSLKICGNSLSFILHIQENKYVHEVYTKQYVKRKGKML